MTALPREDAVAWAERARGKARPAVEATAAGVAWSSLFCWAGTCLVASFHPSYLATPYWYALSGLRTDTCGAAAFLVGAVSLVISKYLRLRRQQGAARAPVPRSVAGKVALVVALCETAAALSSGLVVYISVNAVTHPQTLVLQATHFASWPTEGTLRVLALAACAVSVAVLRYLRAVPAAADA